MTQSHGFGTLRQFSDELAEIVRRVSPSVVRVDDGARLTATGIVWSGDGIVVSTSHGVERDEQLVVEMHDGSRHDAVLVGRDDDTDVAVLRVPEAALQPVTPADSASISTGNLVLALGRPGAMGLQATLGIITSRIESQSGGQAEYILNTDAVLYPGFSGGPLVDMEGNVAGLCNLVFGRGQGVAVGTPTIANVVDAILKGKVQRGYLGVRTQLVGLPDHIRVSQNVEQDRGLLIVQVEAASPAEQGGLVLGDTLLGINGESVSDVEGLRRQLRSHRAGDAATVRILRGGQVQELTITLGAES